MRAVLGVTSGNDQSTLILNSLYFIIFTLFLKYRSQQTKNADLLISGESFDPLNQPSSFLFSKDQDRKQKSEKLDIQDGGVSDKFYKGLSQDHDLASQDSRAGLFRSRTGSDTFQQSRIQIKEIVSLEIGEESQREKIQIISKDEMVLQLIEEKREPPSGIMVRPQRTFGSELLKPNRTENSLISGDPRSRTQNSENLDQIVQESSFIIRQTSSPFPFSMIPNEENSESNKPLEYWSQKEGTLETPQTPLIKNDQSDSQHSKGTPYEISSYNMIKNQYEFQSNSSWTESSKFEEEKRSKLESYSFSAGWVSSIRCFCVVSFHLVSQIFSHGLMVWYLVVLFICCLVLRNLVALVILFLVLVIFCIV